MHIRLHLFDYLAFKLNIGEIVFSRYRDFKKSDPPRRGKSLSFVKFIEGIARSHAFSHSPGNFRVSRVSVDGLRKKSECSSSTRFYQSGNVT